MERPWQLHRSYTWHDMGGSPHRLLVRRVDFDENSINDDQENESNALRTRSEHPHVPLAS